MARMTSKGPGKDASDHSADSWRRRLQSDLDAYLHPQASARQCPNTTAGIAALLAWLAQGAVHRVIFEPTGAYHHRRHAQAHHPRERNPPRATQLDAKNRLITTDTIASYRKLKQGHARLGMGAWP
jgi:hypothetical protein